MMKLSQSGLIKHLLLHLQLLLSPNEVQKICPNLSQSDISFISYNRYSAQMKYQIVGIFWSILTLLVPAIISHSNITFTFNSYSVLMKYQKSIHDHKINF